jgi:catechol-2,3-dioxygenase
VRLQVSDLQRSVEYYREVIGLPVLSSRGGLARLGSLVGSSRVADDSRLRD